MSELLNQPWLGWAIGIAIGLPLALVILTELHNWLVRQDSRMARPVAMMRNFIVPSFALLLLLTQASGYTRQVTGVRVVATVFAFLLMLFVLSGINVVLFGRAEPGSWRRRLPSIFIDIGRLIVVAIGLAVLFSQVWGADVGGLFAALGVTSIVIGLALQNAVGSIIAGLLLLFEQPFALGDWLDTSAGRGRVVEVNWRAVHLETGAGIQIIPNSSLATGSFTNLSQPSIAYDEKVELAFAGEDSPSEVCALIERVVADLPMVDPDSASTASMSGSGAYQVTLHLPTLTDVGPARAQFLSWLWYASRRAGLHYDGGDPDAFSNPDRVAETARDLAGSLQLSKDDAEALAADFRLVRYGHGETLQHVGVIPSQLGVVAQGQLRLGNPVGPGQIDVLSTIERSSWVNPTALTREPARFVITAVGEVVVLEIPLATVETLVHQNPSLSRSISEEMDRRRALADDSVGRAV